jgi:hypothetical protein
LSIEKVVWRLLPCPSAIGNRKSAIPEILGQAMIAGILRTQRGSLELENGNWKLEIGNWTGKKMETGRGYKFPLSNFQFPVCQFPVSALLNPDS